MVTERSNLQLRSWRFTPFCGLAYGRYLRASRWSAAKRRIARTPALSRSAAARPAGIAVKGDTAKWSDAALRGVQRRGKAAGGQATPADLVVCGPLWGSRVEIAHARPRCA